MSDSIGIQRKKNITYKDVLYLITYFKSSLLDLFALKKNYIPAYCEKLLIRKKRESHWHVKFTGAMDLNKLEQ